MPAQECFHCHGWRRCLTCLGRGKRVRVSGLLFRKRQVVPCKRCHGTGLCVLCSRQSERVSAEAATARR